MGNNIGAKYSKLMGQISKFSFSKFWYAIWIMLILLFLYDTYTCIEKLMEKDALLQIYRLIIKLSGLIVFFYLINFWNNRFIVDKDPNRNRNPYRGMFFGSINFVSLVLLGVGIFMAFMVMTDGRTFMAVSILVTIIWAVIFLRYFMWAIYFYNINYGLTDKDWERIFRNRRLKNMGFMISNKDTKGPKYNPYRAQTFGLPPGTVRGMIAFTLLFGGLSIFIAGLDLQEGVEYNSFYVDHFEFFKTAFLMMIAFYFGDSSLRYLQRRWRDPNRSIGNGNQPPPNTSSPPPNPSTLPAAPGGVSPSGSHKGPEANPDHPVAPEDLDYLERDQEFASGESKQSTDGNIVLSTMDSIYQTLQTYDDSEGNLGLIPILDAGHGGLDRDGNYTTGNSKRYKFSSDDLEIYEGVINREIVQKLMLFLNKSNIPYHAINPSDPHDMERIERVRIANELYLQSKRYYFLSIHSNSASKSIEGKGTNATGFEVFTSRGKTQSDELAEVFSNWYKKLFKEYRFRMDKSDGDSDKEADYTVLKYTKCPAVLVENLFFDNRKEAEFLLSEKGQIRIAHCIFKAIEEIYVKTSKADFV